MSDETVGCPFCRSTRILFGGKKYKCLDCNKSFKYGVKVTRSNGFPALLGHKVDIDRRIRKEFRYEGIAFLSSLVNSSR